VKEALGFLMTREIAHQKSFEKALYAIEDNFPPGKLRGIPEYADLYVNTSQGEGDTEGPWNSGAQWRRLDDVVGGVPVDGGAGDASVGLTSSEQSDLSSFAARTMSNPTMNPRTGAELGKSGTA
jgi:Mn-containing catalase